MLVKASLEAGQRQPSRARPAAEPRARGAKGQRGASGHRGPRMEYAGQRGATRVQRRQGKTGQDRASRSAVLGDRGRVRVVRKTLATAGGRQPAIPARMEGISWASLPAACGLELAENVRLNNFLPTALSDVHVHALQVGEPLDTLLIYSKMASSLSYALP
jgi:hypothetical protein